MLKKLLPTPIANGMHRSERQAKDERASEGACKIPATSRDLVLCGLDIGMLHLLGSGFVFTLKVLVTTSMMSLLIFLLFSPSLSLNLIPQERNMLSIYKELIQNRTDNIISLSKEISEEIKLGKQFTDRGKVRKLLWAVEMNTVEIARILSVEEERDNDSNL